MVCFVSPLLNNHYQKLNKNALGYIDIRSTLLLQGTKTALAHLLKVHVKLAEKQLTLNIRTSVTMRITSNKICNKYISRFKAFCVAMS